MVLVTVWFWNDPRPSFAEATLPTLRAHAPPRRQPYVAAMVDDAHALRVMSAEEDGEAAALSEDSAPCARLVAPIALPARTDPRAAPRPLGSPVRPPRQLA